MLAPKKSGKPKYNVMGGGNEIKGRRALFPCLESNSKKTLGAFENLAEMSEDELDVTEIDEHIENEIEKALANNSSVFEPKQKIEDKSIHIPIVGTNGEESSTSIKPVNLIPLPYRDIFSKYFRFFNIVQSTVLHDVFKTDSSVVLSAPTGSGKTVVFELAIVRQLLSGKSDGLMVYIAPIRALCSERTEDWKKKFSTHSDVNILELTGDSSSDSGQQQIENELDKHNLILTTPEKWDVITRRLYTNGQRCHLQRLSLVMIDEIHILGDESRGHTLEAVITRLKRAVGASSMDARFIAASATIPNLEDLANWLRCEKQNEDDKRCVCHSFGEERRPVPLRRVVLGYPEGVSPFKFEMNLGYKISGIVANYSEGLPTLIFVNSRQSTASTSAILLRDLKQKLNFTMNAKNRRILANAADMVMGKTGRLGELITAGIAFHHAGMDINDRSMVEDLFRNGHLSILVSTSTLAMGVNLPAHLVVIKGTKQMISGDYREYDEAQV